MKLTVRNLESGAVEEKGFNSNAKVDEVSTLKRQLQYLYSNDVTSIFMDPETFEQIEIPVKIIGDQTAFIKEGSKVDVLFWSSSTGSGRALEMEVLSVEIPPKVTLKVEETAPGVKGDTTTNVYKPAVLENGLQLKVPLFIKAGDKVRVDTKTGEYVERVNKR